MESQPFIERKFTNRISLLNKNFLLFIIVSFIFIFFVTKNETIFNKNNIHKVLRVKMNQVREKWTDQNHTLVVKKFIDRLSDLNLTALGKILYLDAPRPEMRQKKYKILIWKVGKMMEERHLRYFQTIRHEPFEGCLVNNCELTYSDKEIDNADAVLFHLHQTKNISDIPVIQKRNEKQRWIFLTDESPKHTFLYSYNNHWTHYFDIFNWSMTYKAGSDIPVAYGRTVPLKKSISATTPILDLVPGVNQKRRDVLVAIMISNCDITTRRMSYIKELQKHIDIDIYGGCGTTLRDKCPGHFGRDCPIVNNYLFYLAFENSNCEEYMTEKVFWNAYTKGAIPIILGSTQKNCKYFLPPNSYIHVDEFARPADLATYLKYLNETWDQNIFNYYEWRRHFQIINEHAYFGTKSVHFCRICEALNYNDLAPKIYDKTNLGSFLSIKENCIVP